MRSESIQLLDRVIQDQVARWLPAFCSTKAQRRHHSVGRKRIAAWLRFPRQREDGLYDCLHLARDFTEEGYLYSAEGYLSFFPELPYPPGPFGDHFCLRDILPELIADKQDVLLGERWGGSWYHLGANLEVATLRLETVIQVFRDVAIPQFDKSANALLGDVLLQKALELVGEIDPEVVDAKERMVNSLTDIRPTDHRGYPVGKIVAQLLWRKKGNKSWYKV